MSFKKITYILSSMFLVGLFVYLVQPVGPFPEPPQPSLQSDEPGDSEDTLRRAYFLDYQREEIIQHYRSEVNYMPILRLNYPPEEAQTIIRDQTRSSYLEEITQPFRLSVYVNGFVPTEEKDRILIKGQNFEQKITVRYVPSTLQTRLTFFSLVLVSNYLVIYIVFELFSQLNQLWPKLKIKIKT